MIAMLAVSTVDSSAQAVGATSLSRRAALAGGVATITASASTSSDAGTGPQSSAKPVLVRRIARTVTPVRTANRPDPASASGNRPNPPASDANTGASDCALPVTSPAAATS